jgi:hypothetical protein
LYDRRLPFGVKGPTGNVIGLAQSPGRLGVESALLTLHTKQSLSDR